MEYLYIDFRIKSQHFYDMQCVDLRSIQSNKITGLDEILCTHTHTEGDKDWLHGSVIS